MPLILVQNDRTAGGQYEHWRDIVGERYHFPNQYKNRIEAADRFVYYRGSRVQGARGGEADARSVLALPRGRLFRDGAPS